MADKIVIKNMGFYGYHGVFEAERELGQRFEVDIELLTDLHQAGQTDDLDLTINYVDVFTIAKDIVEERDFRLIETVAEKIAQQLLTTYDITQVVVRVRKPQAALGGLLDYVEVEVERNREDLV